MIFPQSKHLHLWFVKLDEELFQSNHALLLNTDEMKRALRFKFELHRKRYITARASLRLILGQYLTRAPQAIEIATTPTGKPFIPNCDLQFNLSHSDDRALYAIGFQTPVGVDLEKIRSHYSEAVAERFFSPEEYQHLSQLPAEQKQPQFFKIWTGKEALVKALGEGLGFPLSSFTIPDQGLIKTIRLENQGHSQVWYLEHLALFQGYQAAFVTQQKMSQLSFFEWTAEGQKSWRPEEKRSLP